MLDDDLGPVCALGSEAELMVMVPERTHGDGSLQEHGSGET